MSNRRHFLAVVFAGAVGLLGSGAAVAAETATEFAERTSAELVEIIGEAQSYYKTDPDKLHAEIGGLLDRVVDFKGIARGVMGKQYYKAASGSQKEAFAKTFRMGLVKAYSQALVGFGKMDINVLGAKGAADDKKTVDMLAKSIEEGTKVSVRYSMAAKKPGEWIVRNMIIEGINLGQTYRSQFSSSMSQKGGDMDAVIAGWSEIESTK